jgi:F-type H+-transporting ATPase subunit b
MNERDGYINGLNQDILDTEKEMGDIISKLDKKEAEIRKEASELRRTLEDEGNRKASEIHADFRKTVIRLRKETEADVNAQIAEARKQLKAESEVLAVGIMEKVLNRRLS